MVNGLLRGLGNLHERSNLVLRQKLAVADGDQRVHLAGKDLHKATDGLIAAGEVQSMIIVMPDISTMYGGSFCVNSELNGNYEDYMIQDVVPYIDANYRTLPSRDSRGIVGHCMGGYCAMYLTMRHPHVFGAAASHSGMISIVAGILGAQPLLVAENPEGLTITGPDPTKPWTTSLYTLSAAWSAAAGRRSWADGPWSLPTPTSFST